MFGTRRAAISLKILIYHGVTYTRGFYINVDFFFFNSLAAFFAVSRARKIFSGRPADISRLISERNTDIPQLLHKPPLDPATSSDDSCIYSRVRACAFVSLCPQYLGSASATDVSSYAVLKAMTLSPIRIIIHSGLTFSPPLPDFPFPCSISFSGKRLLRRRVWFCLTADKKLLHDE